MSTKLIGTGPNQVPTNADLGSMAYQDSNYVNIGGGIASLSSLTVTDYTKFEIGATAKPTVPASLTMDFAKTQSLDNRIEFSRASIATRTNAKGFIETVTNDVPRFDYDPVTLQCKGLLIEESRTNLHLYSEQAELWNGSPYNVSVTSNVITAPDGTTTADKIVENTASTEHYLSTNSLLYSYTSGVIYTSSCYLKAGERHLVSVYLPGSNFPGAGRVGIFNLLTGTVHSAETGVTALITSVGNGWYRCSVTATANITGSGHSGGNALYDNSGISSYTGDGTSGAYVWGAQLEVGSYATSYIPTTSVAVTRQADVAKITGTNFSSFYNQTEGSFYVEATRPNYTATTNGGFAQSILTVSDDTGFNRILLYSGATSTLYVKNSDVVTVNIITTETWNNLAQQKFAAAYKLNDFVVATGTSTYTDIDSSVPTVNKLTIGSNYATSAGFFNGCIGKIAYYPKRVTNAELLALVRV